MNDECTIAPVASFSIKDVEGFKRQALAWASEYDVFCFLDSNHYPEDRYPSFEAILAVGAESELIPAKGNAFADLQAYHEKHRQWLFGFLTYDLKNEVEQLESKHKDGIGLPAMHFFQAQIVVKIGKDHVEIDSLMTSPEDLWQQISTIADLENLPVDTNLGTQLQSRFTKEEYSQTVEKVREHISLGDIYEMNFCQEFFIPKAAVHPLHLFQQLNKLSQAPFSACYRWKDRYLLCASPERFLKKVGRKLISQPIKGTIKRGADSLEDASLKQALANSAKDRSENVMIVDLVRNDLARSCQAGTVKVEELFGIYGFAQVYQMISTISGELREDLHWAEALKMAFPMGSMTGAPKVSSMQLIEKYERTRRGLYSGAVGYITPEGDFDFNVVIRSMIYNAADQYLSFQVGGAIVYDSVPENEYEECLLKAKGMLAVLNGKTDS